MQKLDRSKLWSLEEYAQKRDAFRAEVIEHKKPRRVALTPNATMYFEDQLDFIIDFLKDKQDA